jgi:AraC-like DNA-binding protein
MDLKELRLHKDAFRLLEGITYRDVSVNGLCLRILGIHFMDNGPGWTVNSHKHSFTEFHYVCEKDVFTNINGVEYQIPAGSFYVIPQSTLHSHRQYNEPWHLGFALRWELIKEDNLNTTHETFYEIKEMVDLLSNIPPKVLQDTGSIFNGMLELLIMAEKGERALLLKTALFRLILMIAGSYPESEHKLSIPVNRSFIDDNIVNIAVKFIEENFSQGIGVNDIAASVHMSYSHLSRLFKTYIGESINNYLTKTKLKKAQYLLIFTTKEMATIAFETGFNSEHYFHEAFKNNLGISPGNYRKSKIKLME